MSDSEDLFGASSDSGGDTDELIAASKASKPIASKKKGTAAPKLKKLGAARLKKKAIPDADNDSDDDEAKGLFDSDDEDAPSKKGTSANSKSASKSGNTSPMSKRERMDALKKKARKAAGIVDEGPKKKKEKGSKEKGADGKEKGYNSGDAYDSGDGGEYLRTKEDDDFIDVEGEDEEVVKEYYKEQVFDDERPDDEEEEDDDAMKVKKGKNKGGSKKRGRGPDALDEADRKDQDNPMMQAVNRMKKKKKVVKSFEDLRVTAEEFVAKMEYTADEDALAIKERRPGLKKLQMLQETVSMLTNREMIRPLLECDVLSAIKRWIQPLPNGSLGNVTVRQSLIGVVSRMGTGEEHGIDTDDLKKSGFGKLVMVLYNHKKETLAMKKQLRALIEEWSRTIFGKSGNMKDLARVKRRPTSGLTAYARAASSPREQQSQSSIKKDDNDGDLGDVISSKVKQGRDAGKNRVRIPYSKGFQYTVRPSDVTGDVTDKKTRISNVSEQRESLHKRMLEKGRPVHKNSRSANMSVEGRATK